MESSKAKSIYKIIMAVALTALITFLGTSIYFYNRINNSPDIITLSDSNNQTITDLDKAIQAIRAVIDNNYLNADQINEQDLVDSAVKGYVAGLGDKYSEFFTADEWATYQAVALGNFEGIGINMDVNSEQNKIEIVSPIPETPAEKAGLKAGDLILKVDGVEYTGDQLTEASNKIKGPAGTTVKLEILRGTETLDFEITREEIRTAPIETKVLENNIGYMKFTTFDEGIAADFAAKYAALQKQGVKSLIIDVRFNGGGYVDGALTILDTLLPKDKIKLITDDKTNGETVYKTKKDGNITMPMVVLVNEYSASATEIFAGALKENGRAKLVGAKTYGKGVIQSVLPVDGGALKITSQEFFTPNKNKINETGIEPDYTVAVPDKYKDTMDIPASDDTQLQKAIDLLK